MFLLFTRFLVNVKDQDFGALLSKQVGDAFSES
jgi:hypothetical protein